MSPPELTLVTVESGQALEAAREIILEYVRSLGVDLAFQGVEDELANLPGAFAPPDGALLLACLDGGVAGCGAFQPRVDVDYPNACEMKRVYVRPAFRRFGLGRVIAQTLLERAREAGYSVMLLDTLDEMEAARELYASLGFVEVPPYYYNPIPGAHYLKADLTTPISRY